VIGGIDMKKVIVEVVCHFDKIGTVMPQKILWPDGRIYEVDKVTEVTQAASQIVGGVGTRYTVRILDREKYLWREGDIWFMEGK
jgi:hypothetical protein